MKWLVPPLAVMTYSMRAYGKLKNNNLWRYRSIYATMFVIVITISVFIGSLIGTITGFVIDGVDVTKSLMSNPVSLLPLAFAIGFVKKIKTRYGL
jgi:hypothetical protein